MKRLPANDARWLAGAAMGLVLLAGCQSPPAGTAPTAELRFHNWWNFYERGVALVQTGKFAAASEDFERCLDLRSGAAYGMPQDMRRARTYGMHFMEGYFPNRELGICLFEMKQPAKALKFLETSLRQEPSGRARHYLNRVHRERLAGRQTPPPEIRFAGALPTNWTRARTVRVSGTVHAEGYVSDLAVNGSRQFIELARTDTPFDETVPLHSGDNTIRIVATDLLGRRGTASIAWRADWRPPQLTLRRIEWHGDQWTVDGACSDDMSLAGVWLDGAALLPPGAAAPSLAIRRSFPRGARPVIEAADAAGNRLRVTLSGEAGAEDGHARAAPPRLAFNTTDGAWDSGCLRLAQAPTAVPAPTPGEDHLPPSLRLSETRDVAVVFADEFFLDGRADDGGGLRSVTVGGENLLAATDGGCVRAYFARRLPLARGTNRFEVVAMDLSSNCTRRALAIVRRDPEYMDEEYRLTVGVPPIVCETREHAGLEIESKRCLEQYLTREPVRFHLLERDEGWDYILREQGLSVSDLADPRAALRIGKMLPAELLLMGTLIADGAGLTVYAKVVETNSGQILFSEDIYTETAREDLSYQLSGLVMKIAQRFPLAEGRIVDVASGTATIDVGARQGIATGARFVVIQPAADGEPRGGSVCRTDHGYVQLDVERVKKDTGVARILPAAAAATIREGYHVYAR